MSASFRRAGRPRDSGDEEGVEEQVLPAAHRSLERSIAWPRGAEARRHSTLLEFRPFGDADLECFLGIGKIISLTPRWGIQNYASRG